MTKESKPLILNGKPQKAYGHIPHMPESRITPSDHTCTEGQKIIATKKTRDKHDIVIVQEKIDGSCTSVAKINGMIIPLTRSGYVANTSQYEQHHHFYNWVFKNYNRFNELLQEGERVCGEWCMQAHGTRYNLIHEPYVIFDIMVGITRKIYSEVAFRIKQYDFISPNTVNIGAPLSIEKAMELVKISGHGAIDPVEGAVWRIERNLDSHNKEIPWKVDFLVKYVRPDKIDGLFLPEISGKKPIWNWRPD